MVARALLLTFKVAISNRVKLKVRYLLFYADKVKRAHLKRSPGGRY